MEWRARKKKNNKNGPASRRGKEEKNDEIRKRKRGEEAKQANGDGHRGWCRRVTL